MNPTTFFLFWIELTTYALYGFSPGVLFSQPKPREDRDG